MNPLVLEIPIPLCDKHRKEHDNMPFFVKTCDSWVYLAIPTELGSTSCRECKNELFLPTPNLSYADLSYANLSYANLSYADLRYANLSYADLSYADLRYANLSYANNIKEILNLDYTYWNKFTLIDKKFKKLLNKKRFGL